jgi:hypothetical protein
MGRKRKLKPMQSDADTHYRSPIYRDGWQPMWTLADNVKVLLKLGTIGNSPAKEVVGWKAESESDSVRYWTFDKAARKHVEIIPVGWKPLGMGRE